MTLTFDWFLPTSGDGRTIYGRGHSLPIARAQALPIPGPIPADRPPDIDYLGQVARAGAVSCSTSPAGITRSRGLP